MMNIGGEKRKKILRQHKDNWNRDKSGVCTISF